MHTVRACVCDSRPPGAMRGEVWGTQTGPRETQIKSLNVSAHSIALRHRSLLSISAAFYHFNNLENSARCYSRHSLPWTQSTPRIMSPDIVAVLSHLSGCSAVRVCKVGSTGHVTQARGREASLQHKVDHKHIGCITQAPIRHQILNRKDSLWVSLLQLSSSHTLSLSGPQGC